MLKLFDYESYFNRYCEDNELDPALSFVMPKGYEAANGTFDIELKTVFINAEYLKEVPDCEKAFYFFHELRHSSQYLCPELFSSAVNRSIQYVIMFDGTCYKVIDGQYRECRLDGGEEYFSDIYLGQPYEVDANEYAYEKVKSIMGDSAELDGLRDFWMPKKEVSAEEYEAIYSIIDDLLR